MLSPSAIRGGCSSPTFPCFAMRTASDRGCCWSQHLRACTLAALVDQRVESSGPVRLWSQFSQFVTAHVLRVLRGSTLHGEPTPCSPTRQQRQSRAPTLSAAHRDPDGGGAVWSGRHNCIAYYCICLDLEKCHLFLSHQVLRGRECTNTLALIGGGFLSGLSFSHSVVLNDRSENPKSKATI